MSLNLEIPPIDLYCNNDALGVVFSFVGGFDMLATIPFVCKRWRKVAKKSPLTFVSQKGWAFALPNKIFDSGMIDVSILASTKHKEFIPYRDLHQNRKGIFDLIKEIYWYDIRPYIDDGAAIYYLLGSMKFDDDTPVFYFAQEYFGRNRTRSIILHDNLFELLCHGISTEMKERMKVNHFDKFNERYILKSSTRKIYKSYRNKKSIDL